MNIKDVAQTTVFICCLVMIPVLGLAYCLYTQSGLEHSEVLDKSFGVMIGVFSGAATLAAAYIASLLFNDWRDVQSATNKSNHAIKTLRSLMEVQTLLDHYESEIVFLYTYNYFGNSDDKLDITKYENLKSSVYKRYESLITEYKLNAAYHYNIYKVKLPEPELKGIDIFSSYLFSINSLLKQVKLFDCGDTNTKGGVSADVYFNHLTDMKNTFSNLIKQVSETLSKDIDLK